MKPILLKLKSFGSYRDETIDFEHIQNGIFLITGDTGAGKTTIFDAITYALFDESSGGKRNSQMMISQYALPGERTQVEFVFRIGKKEYRIVRSPEQTSYKKVVGEDGTVIMQPQKTPLKPSVELTLPDGMIYGGKKKETDEKIKEIIGIDCQQFTQIAMLAQGDFMKLLHAESKKRKEIFAKIIDTHIYYEIEAQLEGMMKQVKTGLEDNEKEIAERIRDISCLEESEYKEEWELKGAFSDDRKDEIFELIASINLELKNEYEAYEEELEEMDKQLIEIQRRMEEARLINQDFEKLEKAKAYEQRLKGSENAHQQRKHSLEQAQRAVKVNAAYQVLSNKQAEYEKKALQAEQVKKAHDDKCKQLLDLEQKKEQIYQAYENSYDKLVQNCALLDARMGLYEEIEELKKQKKELEEKLGYSQQMVSKAQACEKSIHEKQAEIKELEAMYQEAVKFHEKMYHDFIQNQAMALRKELTEGMPCPVCGSIHHEVFDEQDVDVVTKADVDRAKKGMDQAGQKHDLAKQELEQLNEKKRVLQLESETNIAILKTSIQEKEEQIAQKNKSLPVPTRREALAQKQTWEKQIAILKHNKETIDETYQQASMEEGQLKATWQNEVENAKQLKQQRQQYADEFQKACIENGFASEAEYKQARRSDKDMEQMQNLLKQYEDAVKENQNDLKHYIERTQGKEKVDISDFVRSANDLNGRKAAVQKHCKKLYAVLDQNKNALAIIKDKYAQREGMLEEYVVLKSLNDTAGGKISRKKMDFQTYIQRRFFEKVIAAANERLIRMSNKQFILKCRDIEQLGTQGEVGLDLDVYSLVTAQTRDVKSLSGGESFQAALSMALGLSDMIQGGSKIRIDTMFIDEGFGSLSDETRNQALNLLNELSEGNQLIGIISHVSELKAQVETKLIVSKTDSGSKAVWG